MSQQDTPQPEQKAEIAAEAVEEGAAESAPEVIDKNSLVQNNLKTKANGDKSVASAITQIKKLT